MFHLSDLVRMYENFALEDPQIKDFIEKIKGFVEQQSHMPLHYFQVNEQEGYCVLVFDTEQNGKSFDVLVKDLNTGMMMPVLILNSLDEIAFDYGTQGFYYTQVDATGRGKKVFRHQLGSLQQQDLLIYEEVGQDFEVQVLNTLSHDYILIDIHSTFKPHTNEIWLRKCGEKSKFKLI